MNVNRHLNATYLQRWMDLIHPKGIVILAATNRPEVTRQSPYFVQDVLTAVLSVERPDLTGRELIH